MKITFFLTPKAEVAWVLTTATMRQALERMERSRYQAVPILTPDGRYDSTLAEGDLLWHMKRNPELRFADTERVPLSTIAKRLTVHAVGINAEIEDLLALALEQNFVPIVDDREVFVGIVRRRAILAFFQDKMAGVLRQPE
jgi:CBS-domain-containing membrane protein